mmetsp:Transcript_34238/g.91391  ORF Transcript_34238/g.91391 Transcript_34238/m.91391 type:complete len:244 (-) Transcript_34238:533-1264(-)
MALTLKALRPCPGGSWWSHRKNVAAIRGGQPALRAIWINRVAGLCRNHLGQEAVRDIAEGLGRVVRHNVQLLLHGIEARPHSLQLWRGPAGSRARVQSTQIWRRVTVVCMGVAGRGICMLREFSLCIALLNGRQNVFLRAPRWRKSLGQFLLQSHHLQLQGRYRSAGGLAIRSHAVQFGHGYVHVLLNLLDVVELPLRPQHVLLQTVKSEPTILVRLLKGNPSRGSLLNLLGFPARTESWRGR